MDRLALTLARSCVILASLAAAGCAGNGESRRPPPFSDVGDRIALVVSGVTFEFGPHGSDGRAYVRIPEGPKAAGTATALTTDGYFLTAAHCVERQPTFVFVKTPEGGVYPRPARVVWSGTPRDRDADVALLKVDAPCRAAFEWAGRPRPRDETPVAAARARRDGTTSDVCGGAVVIAWRAGEAPPAVAATAHTAPLQTGYSGGPLYTRAGRLVGVNVLRTRIKMADGTWLPVGIALRPDAAFLDKLIRRDRASGGVR